MASDADKKDAEHADGIRTLLNALNIAAKLANQHGLAVSFSTLDVRSLSGPDINRVEVTVNRPL